MKTYSSSWLSWRSESVAYGIGDQKRIYHAFILISKQKSNHSEFLFNTQTYDYKFADMGISSNTGLNALNYYNLICGAGKPGMLLGLKCRVEWSQADE